MGFAFSVRDVILEISSNKYCIDIYNGCRDLQKHWTLLNEIQDGLTLLEDPKMFELPINMNLAAIESGSSSGSSKSKGMDIRDNG